MKTPAEFEVSSACNTASIESSLDPVVVKLLLVVAVVARVVDVATLEVVVVTEVVAWVVMDVVVIEVVAWVVMDVEVCAVVVAVLPLQSQGPSLLHGHCPGARMLQTFWHLSSVVIPSFVVALQSAFPVDG